MAKVIAGRPLDVAMRDPSLDETTKPNPTLKNVLQKNCVKSAADPFGWSEADKSKFVMERKMAFELEGETVHCVTVVSISTSHMEQSVVPP